jgi:hypothetical protein
MNEQVTTFLSVLGSILLICFFLGLLLIALVYRRLRRIKLPPNADFWTTVRAVPFTLVLALDLLDLGLDMFSAPIVWVVLNRFRLQSLRNVAAAQALIPFSQAVPTLTLAWFAARMLGLGQDAVYPHRRIIDTDQSEPGAYVPRIDKR